MPENTALIDEIMAALDAENSTNVELIVRNTQNGATKKMPLASLEQIIYNYLTSSSVAAQLASVLGVSISGASGYSGSLNSITKPSVYSFGAAATDKPFEYGVLVTFPIVGIYQAQIAFNISSGKQFASRVNGGTWHLYEQIE